jgi:hypothetical protein
MLAARSQAPRDSGDAGSDPAREGRAQLMAVDNQMHSTSMTHKRVSTGPKGPNDGRATGLELCPDRAWKPF